MKNYFLILVAGFFLWTGCQEKENDDDFRWYHYNRTFCADLSNTYSNGTFENFFEVYQVEYRELKYTTNSDLMEICNACNCLNGEVAHVYANIKSERTLLDFGFYR